MQLREPTHPGSHPHPTEHPNQIHCSHIHPAFLIIPAPSTNRHSPNNTYQNTQSNPTFISGSSTVAV